MDLTNIQHSIPLLGLLVIGVFHFLNVLLTQVSQFVTKVLQAIRRFTKKFRVMKRELHRPKVERRMRPKGSRSGRKLQASVQDPKSAGKTRAKVVGTKRTTARRRMRPLL